MTNVSKQKLPKKHLDKIYKQLHNAVGRLNNRTSAEFFNDLLGPEEQIMLTKRLATVAMYIEGNSSYRVSQLLKISPSTAENIRKDYEMGRYDNVKKILTKNKADYEQFWKTLDVVLRAGMPPMGRGRWKSFFDQK